MRRAQGRKARAAARGWFSRRLLDDGVVRGDLSSLYSTNASHARRAAWAVARPVHLSGRGLALAALAVYASGAVFWTAHEFLNHLLVRIIMRPRAARPQDVFADFRGRSLERPRDESSVGRCHAVARWVLGLPSVVSGSDGGAGRARDICERTVLVLFPTLRQTLYEGLLRGASATTLDASSGLVTVCAAFATLASGHRRTGSGTAVASRATVRMAETRRSGTACPSNWSIRSFPIH